MKILTQLSATPIEAQWTEPRGILQAVHDEPVPGFIRSASLGAGGVLIKKGDAVLGIPLAELFRLAEAHEPAMIPPSTLPPES